MTKHNNDLRKNLENLQTALASLQIQDLSPTAQAGLEQVMHNLNNVLENVDLGEEQSRLATLYRVTQALGTSLQLDEVFNQVIDAVVELTEAERGFLVLAQDAQNLKVRAGRNMEQQTLEQDDMQVSRTVIRTVLETGEGVLTTNAQDDPRFAGKESVVGLSLLSIMCSPLRVRDKVIGVIYVDSRARAGLFHPEDIELLNTFAIQAAAAIENARIHTQTDRSLATRLRELENLTQAAREMNNEDQIERTLSVACRWATDSTHATQAWIALRQIHKNEANLVIMTGPQAEQIIAASDPLVAEALQANTPIFSDSTDKQPARLVVPIISKTQALGVMVLEAARPFTAENMQFASRLANQTAPMIEKTMLAEQIQTERDEKGQFVSVLAHELRIPMTSIQGYTDLLLQGALGPVSEQQKEFLGVIRKNVRRMSTLVSDISDIYKVKSGRLRLELTSVDLADAAGHSIDTLSAALEEKSQTVTLQAAPGLPKLNADPNQIEKIFKNLLRNASMYSPQESSIEVEIKQKGDHIYTSITDHGLGISPEDQEQIFTEFFRSERSEVRELAGWGLGLSVAYQLVHLMGGEIGCQSQLDQGSTFWFTLPITAAA